MFLFLIFARLQVLNTRSINQAMKRLPKGLIIISSKNPNCLPCKRLEKAFENLSTTFQGKIQFGLIEAEANPDYTGSIGVTILPSVAVYIKGLFVKLLEIDLSQKNLERYCQGLISPPITKIHTLAEYYNFTLTQQPSNIVIYDPKNANLQRSSIRAISEYGVEALLGQLMNSSVSDFLGFNSKNSFVQINKPLEKYSVNNTDFTAPDIVKNANSNIRFLDSPEMFGMATGPESVVTFLYDERDPFHINEISKIYRHLYDTFGRRLNYQVCDFFNCPFQAESYAQPDLPYPIITVSHRRNGMQSTVPFTGKSLSFDRVDRFINTVGFGIQAPGMNEDEKPEDDAIPYLLGTDFQRLVLDPTYDVLIFVASPSMKQYHAAREQFKKLMQLFGLIHNVMFYEFNPVTQHVMGLQIPRSDKPQISIWPAQEEPNGGTLPALAPLHLICENVLPLIKNKYSQDVVVKMQEMLQQFLRQ